MKIDSIDWKSQAPSRGIDAEKAFNALEEVRQRNDGDLTDDTIIEAARPKNHVLHKWFEWDDTKAANEHRRTQARQLVRSFVVTYAESKETPVRAYEVHRKTRPGSEKRTAYRTTDEVMADPDARDRLIASAIRMAMEFRRRFRGLHELQKIVEAIEETLPAMADGE